LIFDNGKGIKMKTFNKIAFGIAGLFMLVGTANAATLSNTYDWGVHDSGEADAGIFLTTTPLSFEDTYKFLLNSAYDALAVSVSNDVDSIFNISNGEVSLFKNVGSLSDFTDDGAALGTFSFDSTAINQTFTNLAAGNYYYRVTGDVDGSQGGSYLLSSTITPVPEADTYAMMLAGLGLMGFMVRRRRGE
jgi:hypothetical protein